MAEAFSIKVPDFRKQIARDAADFKKRQERAARVAAHKTSLLAQKLIQGEMASAGLGKLTKAVLQTSALKKRQPGAWGVVYAAGGDDSLAGGALEAYNGGDSIIRYKNKQWLAFQTNVIPRRVGRYRMTPARYVAAGFNTTLGKLEFKPINSHLAFLVVKNTTQHIRTGRIKRPGKRASKVRANQKEVVVFILIKFTVRAGRFNKDKQAAIAVAQFGTFFAEEMERG